MSYLGGFARVNNAQVATRERGEAAYAFEGEEASLANLEGALSGPEDVHQIMLELDLSVTLDPDKSTTWLERCGLIVFELDEHSEEDQSITMWLSIDSDIYASLTWGEQRHNEVLARINGPRLTTFLAVVREGLHGIVDAIDAEDYVGSVDESGFR